MILGERGQYASQGTLKNDITLSISVLTYKRTRCQWMGYSDVIAMCSPGGAIYVHDGGTQSPTPSKVLPDDSVTAL